MRARASLLVVPFLVVACGGTVSTPAAPASATPAPVEVTPGPASPLDPAACPEVPEPTGTPCIEVVIRGFAFDPASVSVPTVARIVFVNEDAAAHSIEWADGAPTSPTLGQGATTAREFIGVPAGTIGYVCGIHGASMSGEIVFDETLPIP
jgi:plastocyanin